MKLLMRPRRRFSGQYHETQVYDDRTSGKFSLRAPKASWKENVSNTRVHIIIHRVYIYTMCIIVIIIIILTCTQYYNNKIYNMVWSLQQSVSRERQWFAKLRTIRLFNTYYIRSYYNKTNKCRRLSSSPVAIRRVCIRSIPT